MYYLIISVLSPLFCARSSGRMTHADRLSRKQKSVKIKYSSKRSYCTSEALRKCCLSHAFIRTWANSLSGLSETFGNWSDGWPHLMSALGTDNSILVIITKQVAMFHFCVKGYCKDQRADRLQV